MKKLHASVAEFLRAEDGQTALEYAIMLSLIVTVCSLPIGQLGDNVNDNFAAAAEGADGSYASTFDPTSSTPTSADTTSSGTTTPDPVPSATTLAGTTTSGTTTTGISTTSSRRRRR